MSLSDKLFGQEPDRTYGPDALPTIEPAEHARWRKNRNKVIAKGVGVVTAIAAAISLAVGGVVANDRWQARQEAILQEYVDAAHCSDVDDFIVIGTQDPKYPNYFTNAPIYTLPSQVNSIGQNYFAGYVNQTDYTNSPYTHLGAVTVCVANTPNGQFDGFVPNQTADPDAVLLKSDKNRDRQVWISSDNVA